VFDRDLNVPLVEALGFTVPPQVPPGPRKETAGFWLYRDRWESGSHEGAAANGGLVDFFDTDRPHGGSFSIGWTDVGRYGWVGWTFAPYKDLSDLADAAALSFWVRTTAPRFSFDVRFVDAAGSGPDALPWRLGATFDQTQIPHDGQWHHLEIPLSEMKVTGAWDGTWHAPQKGAFRWNRVARLEFVAEQTSLEGVTLHFDDVSVTVEEGAGTGECP
jgi:endoglucanase